MYIFQPDRFQLREQVSRVGKYISGRTIDIGAGTSDRYSASFDTKEYVRMDIGPRDGIDIVGTIYDIPFPDDSFDSIVCTQVLEYVARPVDAVREMYRILKLGGHALITVPQMNELHEEPHDYFRYTSFGLRALFEDAGFKVVDLNQRGGFYSTIAQLRIRFWIDSYRLYERPLLGRIAGKGILLYGKFAIWRDRRSTAVASRKHAIGWCLIVEK